MEEKTAVEDAKVEVEDPQVVAEEKPAVPTPQNVEEEVKEVAIAAAATPSYPPGRGPLEPYVHAVVVEVSRCASFCERCLMLVSGLFRCL